MNKTCEIIKKLRKLNNLTMDELVERMKFVASDSNISKSAISRWEHGTEPSIKSIQILSQIFNVSTDFLLGLDNKINIFEIIDNYKRIAVENKKMRASDIKAMELSDLLILRKQLLVELKDITKHIVICEECIDRKTK